MSRGQDRKRPLLMEFRALEVINENIKRMNNNIQKAVSTVKIITRRCNLLGWGLASLYH